MTKLTNGDVSLRPLNETDAQALALLANNKKISDNLRDAFPCPYKLEDAVGFISVCEQEEPVFTFAIEYKGEFCGIIGLVKQMDVYRLSAELGYWLGEPFWNKGIMNKAAGLIVKYAFDHLDLIRLFSGVFEYNKASRRVLEKAGFTLEAIFKNSVFKNGKIFDEYRYCYLKPDKA
jgi:RimJ/RimL family protein N-acetyltransferase